MKSLTLVLIALTLTSCSALGQNPSGDYLERISRSEQFHRYRGKFVNRNQTNIDLEKRKRNRFKTIGNFIFSGSVLKPDRKLPEIKPDINAFKKVSAETKFIWLGHSTFLVNIRGKILLFDPVFSNHASPVSFAIKRFQAPAINLEDLPKVDFIVISHDHYDHLDMNSIKFFKDKDTKFVVPLGVPSHLKFWGVKEEKIVELDWWQSAKFEEIEIVSTPAQHFSGRSPEGNLTLWSSWVVKTDHKNIFYSGDTGYDVHFEEIGKKYGPFEVAFMENGQYNEAWQDVHMLPEQTVQAFEDVKGESLVSVHWGMFDLSIHNWYDPIEEVSAIAAKKKIRHLTPRLGELVIMNGSNKFEQWWKPFLPKSK